MVGRRTLDYPITNKLISKFINSRRQGLSPTTIKFYSGYLKSSVSVIGINVAGSKIIHFLNTLQCTNGGKHAYFRTLRAFYRWLYSAKSGYRLNPQDNPILIVDPPKVERRLLPSVTSEQVECLINTAESVRDKCIVSLFADSGLRLHEMAKIGPWDIDWSDYTIAVIGKGNKQRRAPFTYRTAKLLKFHLESYQDGNKGIWGINEVGIHKMLKRLSEKTGIKCNPHAFRRGFACNLHRKGLSTLDIMHLGGWSDLSMVIRYTRSITFEDCLEHYKRVLSD